MTQPSGDVCVVAWPWREVSPSVEAAARRAARRSGTIQGLVGFAAAALFLWWLHRPTMAAVVATFATINVLAALLSPLGLYRYITAAVGALGKGIGQVVTWVLMPIVYLLLFTLFGLALRAGGKLRITRRPDRSLPTYWRELPGPRTPESYQRQF